MKKLLILSLVILLTGCATVSQESFLDEKIKCKKLADARIEELKDGTVKQFEIIGTNYYAPDSSCILAWREYLPEHQDTNNQFFIEDLTTYRTIAYYDASISISDLDISKLHSSEFNEKMEVYFGKDARLYFPESSIPQS